jgi:YVTN family beta-propeller protein
MLAEVQRARAAESTNARMAGRSEIAVSVMHNVGTLINSVNVSANLCRDRAAELELDDLRVIYAELVAHRGNLDDYLTSNERGQHLLPFLEAMLARLELEYSRPHGIEYLADGERVAITVETNKALIVVDVASGDVLQAIDTDQEVSHMVALTPDAKRAFVANIGSGSMTAIDLEKGERIANVPTGKGAEGICVTPDGRHVWVSNRDADTVSVIDSESLEVVKTLPSAEVPIRAKATPDGKWVLVTNADSGELAVFDASTMSEHRRFRIEISADETSGRGFGGQGGESSVPIGVLIAPDSKRAYVAHANAHVVSVIDLETFEVVDYLRAGRVPDGLGYSRVDVAR